MTLKILDQGKLHEEANVNHNEIILSSLDQSDIVFGVSFFNENKEEIQQEVLGLDQNYLKNENVLFFVEAMEKGGGFFEGLLEGLMVFEISIDLSYRGFEILTDIIAQESWDLVKKRFQRIFKQNEESSVIRVKTKNGIPINYILPKGLDPHKSAEALETIAEHFKTTFYSESIDFTKNFMYVEELRICKEF